MIPPKPPNYQKKLTNSPQKAKIDPGLGEQYSSFKVLRQPVGSSYFMSDSTRGGYVSKKGNPGPAYYYKASKEKRGSTFNANPKKSLWL